jgi:hypothetical protein
MLKFLLKISKALVYSKIKFLFRKEFFLHFRPKQPSGQLAHAAFRPSHDPPFFSTGRSPLSPLGLDLSAGPARPHGPAGRLLPPPAPKQCAQAPTTGRPHAAPWTALTTSARGKITAASLLLHSPIKRRHSPSSIPGNRRLQSRGFEAFSTPAIEGTWPPPP